MKVKICHRNLSNLFQKTLNIQVLGSLSTTDREFRALKNLYRFPRMNTILNPRRPTNLAKSGMSGLIRKLSQSGLFNESQCTAIREVQRNDGNHIFLLKNRVYFN